MDIAIPSFGYKNHISICRGFGFVRKSATAQGARHYGSQLSEVVATNNTASDVWADTAYRSMAERTRKANSIKSKVRARVEHVFAQQKADMVLFIRTIGLKRAESKIILANLAFTFNAAGAREKP